MAYNREELSALGFRLKKVRREIEGMEDALGKLLNPDPSLVRALKSKKIEMFDLEAQFAAVLERGKASR